MTIILNLPEDIAKELSERGGDLSRAALESLALEGYGSGRLSEEQVRRMLSFDSRFEVHAFLKQHDTHLDYTEADLEQDLAMARSLNEGWLSSQTAQPSTTSFSSTKSSFLRSFSVRS